MQKAHFRLFILERQSLRHGTDEHFQQSAADGINGGGDKKSRPRHGQKIGKKGQKQKPDAGKAVRGEEARPIADLIHEQRRREIDKQLNPEIDGDHRPDERQTDIVIRHKGDEQERCEIDDDRLRDVAYVTRAERVVDA